MHRSEMNSFAATTVPGHWMLALLSLLVSVPAMAQSDTVRVTAVSTWQKDVDQLRQELLEQRRLEVELYRMLGRIEARRRAAADSQRTDLTVESRLVFGRLQEAGIEQVRLRRQLETMCAGVQKPDGWLGVATTGFQLLDRQVNGPQVIRFLEPPVVASVDPGSPAERVGLRAGDVLVELGGKKLLHANVIFAELLRPGEKLAVKLRRGDEIMTLTPTIEPLPEVTATPCTWVDAGTAYVMAPVPVQARIVEVGPNGGPGGFAYTYTRGRKDSTAVAAAPPAGGVVFASPMAGLYSAGGRSLAGLELVALNQESGRAFGVTHGLFVNQVLPGTPGREAGLQGGDVLVSADSVDLRTFGSLQRVISRSRDRTVTIMIVRDRRAEKVQLRW